MPALRIESAFSLIFREDPVEMAAYVRELEQRLRGGDETRAPWEARAVALSKSALALETLKRLALESENHRDRAIGWLGSYPREQTEGVVIEVATGVLTLLIVATLSGVFGNLWYLRQAESTIRRARAEEPEGVTRKLILAEFGGTSMIAALLAPPFVMAGLFLAMSIVVLLSIGLFKSM